MLNLFRVLVTQPRRLAVCCRKVYLRRRNSAQRQAASECAVSFPRSASKTTLRFNAAVNFRLFMTRLLSAESL